jgi:hypothetical protein
MISQTSLIHAERVQIRIPKQFPNEIPNDCNMAIEAVPDEIPNDCDMITELVPNEIEYDHRTY